MKMIEKAKKTSGAASGKNNFGKIAVLSMVIMVIAAVLAIYGSSAKGAFDEADAITFREYKANHNIENSVLFIGTYIIHKDAMTEELYEKAYDSAASSGQEHNFYFHKSDLFTKCSGIGMSYTLLLRKALKSLSDTASCCSRERVSPIPRRGWVPCLFQTS